MAQLGEIILTIIYIRTSRVKSNIPPLHTRNLWVQNREQKKNRQSIKICNPLHGIEAQNAISEKILPRCE